MNLSYYFKGGKMKKLRRIKVIALVDVQEGNEDCDWFTPSTEHSLVRLLCAEICKAHADVSGNPDLAQFANAEVVEAEVEDVK